MLLASLQVNFLQVFLQVIFFLKLIIQEGHYEGVMINLRGKRKKSTYKDLYT